MENDLNREVGEIKEQVRSITGDVSEIKSDVKKLLAFKWQIAGMVMVISTMCTFIGGFLIEAARAK